MLHTVEPIIKQIESVLVGFHPDYSTLLPHLLKVYIFFKLVNIYLWIFEKHVGGYAARVLRPRE